MSDRLDYAIIGAGVSGCYSAWRLKQQYPDKAMALFENSNRIGGRLYSRYLPGMPHVTAELGGMRYMPDSQPLITNIIRLLGIPTQVFPMGAPPPVGDSENIMFLRNTFFRNKQMNDANVVPYHVSPSERNKTPDDLQAFVTEYLIPHGGHIPQRELFDTDVFGRKLYEYGYWDLLLMVLSSEAYEFIKDGGGYDTNVVNGNAVSMLPIQERGAATKFLTPTDGMESLPRTLAAKFAQEGGTCRKNARLKSITSHPNGGYRLDFVNTETIGCKTRPTDESFAVEAHHVILAMPRMALQSIAWAQFEENDWLRENIPAVAKQPAFKIFMGYETPWWRALNLVAGRSITDLPIRQTYYFGTEGQQPDANPNNTNSLLMASYNDTGAVPFWKGLERGRPFLGKLNPFLDTGEAPVPHSDCDATELMIDAAHNQVQRMHQQQRLPGPYTAVYQDWTEWPYGGGWHVWKPGYRFLEIIERMVHPVPGEQVYICGEAYSNNQGWVEGALETAESMLSRLGVPSLPTD